MRREGLEYFQRTPDGRFVLFSSGASDLGPTDTNGTTDAYVRDLPLGTTTLVSLNSAGTDSGNALSGAGAMTPDGRFVAFPSEASDLGPTDTNGTTDVYLRDLQLGTTTLVSVNSVGTDSGNNFSFSTHLTTNGRFLLFQSEASDLVPTDTNGARDVYLRDLQMGTTTLVSVNSAGTDSGNGPSFPGGPSVAEDGRAAFQSDAFDLVPTDTNGARDVFVTAPQPASSDDDVEVTTVSSNLPLSHSNQPLQLFATVANNGPTDLPLVEVLLFLDLDSNLMLDGGEPSVLTTLTNLVAGMSQTAVGVFPDPLAGSYLGVATADPNDLIAESNETNNSGSTALDITLPDLTVTGLTSLSSAKRNGTFKVLLNATVENIGLITAANVRVQFASSTDGVIFTNITGQTNAGAIAAGGSVVAEKKWNKVLPGAYTIRVTADPKGQVNESDERNNVSTFFPVVVP